MAERDARRRWELMRLRLGARPRDGIVRISVQECEQAQQDLAALEAEFVQRGEEIERLTREAKTAQSDAEDHVQAIWAEVVRLQKALRDNSVWLESLISLDVLSPMLQAGARKRLALDRAALAGPDGGTEPDYIDVMVPGGGCFGGPVTKRVPRRRPDGGE